MSRLVECARISILVDTLLNMERYHLNDYESKLVDEVTELLIELEVVMAKSTLKSQ